MIPDFSRIKAEIDDIKSAEIESLRAAMLAGIRIMPHAMIDRPTIMVPEATWNALVVKYGLFR